LRDGQSLTVGKMLSSKRETEWLVSEMRRLTVKDARTVSTGAAS